MTQGVPTRAPTPIETPPRTVRVRQATGASDRALSATGHRAGGMFRTETGEEQAFVWSEASGPVDLADQLAAHGVDLAGWKLHAVEGMSEGGTVLVGSGTSPQGQPEAWRATGPRLALHLARRGGGGIRFRR